MDSNWLSPLLVDYQERSADYRRQVGHYAKILKPVLALLIISVGWVLFADPVGRPLWVLPFAIGIGNATLLLLPYFYRSSQLMLTYLLRLEIAFNQLCLSSGAVRPIHHVDGLSEPSIFVGFYTWKLRCRETPSAKAWRCFIVPLLVVTFALLEVGVVLLSFKDPFFDNAWTRSLALVLFLACPAIIGSASYAYNRFRVKQERQMAIEDPIFSPESMSIDEPTVREIVFADYQQRNADFRFLGDYYNDMIIYVLAAFAAFVGAWVHQQQMGFLFLLFPPVLLLCTLVDLFVYRLIKRLKRYLAKTEALMEQWMECGECPPVHSVRAKDVTWSFRIGFVRFVRKKYVQDTEGLSLPLYVVPIVGVIVLVALALLCVCLWKGAEWVNTQGIDSPYIVPACSLFLLGLFSLNIALYFSSIGIGRDPTAAGRRKTMYQQVVAHCSTLSVLQLLVFALLFALGVELLTAWGRFGLGVQATRDTGLLGVMTFGIRIHHGYIGLLLMLIAWGLTPNVGIRNALLMVGIGLVASDLMHHFLVLWPITGSPEFDLFYPKPGGS